ncbi:MAG: thiol:disulfide interchange protein DsbC [Sulfurimonas sp.]|jgi:thiol:disulfide interchange protein DsbC|uniref:thioredoxin fold domain-containing protein n=1 Tax=Sulfurimonas sp. TaxID=2022749 RepID=UPI0039E52BC5
MIHTKMILIFTALFLSISLFADNTALKMIIEKVPMIKNINAKVTHVEVHKGLYQFKAKVMGPRPGIVEGFITKDFSNIVIGKGYDAKTAQELTIPFDLNIKTLKNIAAYTLGSGKDEYFVFTDPECPYCQKLEHKLTSLKNNVTVYVILFPLSFHKNAKSMCRYILNQEDNVSRAKAMKEIANKSTKYKKATYSKMELKILNGKIQESIDEVNRIGINGTPSILNAKGIKVPDKAILR